MKRIFICMLMCLAAVLPLSFLAAADDPASEAKQFVPGPVTDETEYADTRWTEADTDGEVCTHCGGDDILLESVETSWGAYEYVPCSENVLINDTNQDRLVLQQMYCGDCNFLQRKQVVRETRLVCTNETYQLVRR